MRYLPDGIRMKAADTYTIQELGIPSLILMERAALGVVQVMEERGMDLTRALIVCGSGNNGGDGFAVARLLSEKGLTPEVLFAGRESSLSEECAVQKRIVEKLGIPVFTELPEQEYTVIIDAVFGVGLSREISGRYLEVIEWMNAQPGRKAAIDIPSGVCARTGRILGTAFQAELTVAMACVKLGCELYPGKSAAGETAAVQIGISPAYFKGDRRVCFTYDREDLPLLLPPRRADSHKGTYGRVLMITGSSGMAGAACLAGWAAYGTGAGLIQIYTAQDNRQILQEALPEAIVTCYEDYDRETHAELLAWADVICIGCGLGKSRVSEQLLIQTLKYLETNEKPCIIDADGLNLLSTQMEQLEALADREVPVILTPHMKEMSRLTGKSVEWIAENRQEVLDEFVSRYPAVCVLKDSRTMAAQKEHPTFVNLAGNSAMAKAGSGDVLAGVITGLAAQGMDPFDSAALGVYLHACGGDEAWRRKGSYSVLARDLIAGVEECMAQAERCGRTSAAV